MAKRIEKVDLSVENPFENIINSAKKAETEVDLLSTTLKAVDEQIKELKKQATGIKITAKADNLKAVKELNDAEKEALRIAKERESMEKIRVENVKLHKKAVDDAIKSAEKKAQVEASSKKAIDEANEATARSAKATRLKTQAEKENIDVLDKYQKLYQKTLGTLDQNTKTLNFQRDELKKVRNEIKFTTGEKANLLKREQELKLAISENTMLVKKQTKEQAYASDSGKKLSIQLELLRDAYSELSEEERKTPFGVELLSTIQELDSEMKSFDGSIGKFTRHVGDYGQSMIKSLEASDLFKTGISQIDGAIGSLIGMMSALLFSKNKDTIATNENTASARVNANATSGMTKAMKNLNNVLKVSIIGTILLLLGSVVATFKQGDEGAKKMNSAMTYLSAGMTVVIQVFVKLFKSIGIFVDEIKIMAKEIQLALTFDQLKVVKLKNEIKELKNGITEATAEMSKMKTTAQIWEEAMKDAAKSNELFNKTFDSRRRIISYKKSISDLSAQVQEYSQISDDATLSTKTQSEAMFKSQKKEISLLKTKVALAKEQKKLIDAEVARAQLGSAGGGDVESEEKKAEALLAISDAEGDLTLATKRHATERRQIQIEEFEERLRISQTVSDYNREFFTKQVKDEKKSVQDRIKIAEDGIKSVNDALQQSLTEFETVATSLGKKMNLQYKEGKVFLNDQLLMIDDAKKLQEQLLALDLPKNISDQFAVFLGEKFKMGQLGVQMFEQSVLGLTDALEGLKNQTAISEAELATLSSMNDEYRKLLNAPVGERKNILEKIKALDEEMLQQAEKSAIERLEAEIKAMEDELKSVEDNSISKEEILKKQADAEIEIEKIKNTQLRRERDEQKKQEDIDAENEKKRLAERKERNRKFTNDTIDEIKRLSKEEEQRIDKRINDEKELQNNLQAQANAGNISAQQSIEASREAEKKATIEKMKEQKKQQALDDIKTLYALINANIDKGDGIGIATSKAVASMGVVKAVAKVFSSLSGFAKGTGWRLGQEHKPMFGGVDGHVVRVDSSEAIIKGSLMDKAEKAGISSTSEMVQLAISQKMNPNMYAMNDDRLSFVPIINQQKQDFSVMEKRLESIENTIKNKTEFSIDPYVLNGMVKGIVESQKTGNFTRKNIYR